MSDGRPQHRNEDQFHHIIEDAKELLAYAVEEGIEVDADTAQKIIAADKDRNYEWLAGSNGGTVLASRLLKKSGAFADEA